MKAPLTTHSNDRRPRGCFIERDSRWLYEIEHVDSMPPFLMTVVCDSDCWLFLSSRSTMTAGRVEADRCLLPYETDDRLHDLAGTAGPITSVRFGDGRIWRPLLDRRPAGLRVLRRSLVGDRVEFEETDEISGLTFRVELGLSDRFGIVRRCELYAAEDSGPIDCELLDGYLNVMPAGVPLGLQQTMSTLVDGYSRSELVGDRGPAVYVLESLISDRPEATEALRANVVWHTGLDGAAVSLTADAVLAFESGGRPTSAGTALGRRGAYLCRAAVRLSPGERERWNVIGDVGLDHSAIGELRAALHAGSDVDAEIDRSLRRDAESLARLLDDADGSQATRDTGACAAHRSNVLFNSMRGGVPLNGFRVDAGSFREFVRSRHAGIAAKHEKWLADLDDVMDLDALLACARDTADPQLQRLSLEYLPLTFGRRHGDPSRPWNRFRIQVRDDLGNRIHGYEGNWRDIFQNWEAMCRSYPALLPGVIAKFVNASTVDGYNPYRINEGGIDWEVPEPGNPRSNIGYWGDHQIIYLLRLLEQYAQLAPEGLSAALESRVFSYANLPYRLESFDEIAAGPQASIRFDEATHNRAESLSASIGGDGRLVLDEDDEPALVTLLEKLLVTALAKVSNLVPGGGVWMNTMRPEWNDANNALAGFGLSMVTLFHLRRFCDFASGLLADAGAGTTPISAPIAEWCAAATAAMERATDAETDDVARWRTTVALGRAAQTAREQMYEAGPGRTIMVERGSAREFFTRARELCDRSIRHARRPDGLFHSYNVLHLAGDRASVEHLDLMLEGQVAAIASGVLEAGSACDLLDSLFRSEIYRADQRTFILYPRVDLPPFMDRNIVAPSAIAGNPLLERALDEPGAGLLAKDRDGNVRFGADLNSHDALEARLRALADRPGWSADVASGSDRAHSAFEQTFRHAQFTGRSGRMHKYEGLGSVYWHMVSKLLLSTQECLFEASDSGADPELTGRLRHHYAAIRDGLGFRKTPEEYGAVPHEPYSHTPWGAGAQQPGMTGQVKEGVLARFGELGVRVMDGCVRFDPALIDPAELLDTPRPMIVRGEPDRTFEVPTGAVGLTLCATPIIVRATDRDRIVLHTAEGGPVTIEGRVLSRQWSTELFARSGRIEMIEAVVSTPAHFHDPD